MNKKMLGALLLTGAFLLVPLTVQAQEDDVAVKPDRVIEQQENALLMTTLEADPQLAQANEKESLESRQAARKARIEAKLTAAEERRVRARCKAAQVRLQALTAQATTHRQVREKNYENLTARLDAMVLRLQNNDIDASKLETANDAIDSKIADFFTHFDSYQSALADAVATDCEADPAGFYVALQDARELRKDLKAESKEIRDYIRENIRQVFASIKKGLTEEATKPEEDDEETTEAIEAAPDATEGEE